MFILCFGNLKFYTCISCTYTYVSKYVQNITVFASKLWLGIILKVLNLKA